MSITSRQKMVAAFKAAKTKVRAAEKAAGGMHQATGKIVCGASGFNVKAEGAEWSFSFAPGVLKPEEKEIMKKILNGKTALVMYNEPK